MGVVLAAGEIEIRPAVSFDRDIVQDIFELNFVSQMKLLVSVIPRMVVSGGGSIVTVSSNTVSHLFGGRAAYAASKAALATYTLTLAREMGSRGIRANVIEPGLTDTQLMKKSTTDVEIDLVTERTSLRRISSPEDIACTVVFLLSDACASITGQVLRVDNGY